MTRLRSEVEQLERHIGRVVMAEAEWGNECWSKPVNGTRLYLLKNVVVYPFAEIAHLWVAMDMKARRRVYPGERFHFRAIVVEYRNERGHKGVTLGEVSVV